MNIEKDHHGKSGGVWPSLFVGGLILLISLVHIPASQIALNFFDPPKRLLWALMAFVLAWSSCRRGNRLKGGPLWVAMGLLTWMVLRTVLRPVPAAEIEVLFTWILPILMLMLGGSLAQDKHSARILGGCLLLAGLIQAGIMLLQRVGWDPFFFETTSIMTYKPGRMLGTIGYQNQAVDFLALSGTGIFLLTRAPVWRLAVLISLLLVSCLTGNRGGILAFTSALLVYQLLWVGLQEAWVCRRRRQAVMAVLALGFTATCLLGAIPETRKRFQEAILHFRTSPATASRIHMADVGVEMFKEKPLTGWGAGEYALQYLERLGAVLPEEKTHPLLATVFFAREAHQDGLQFIVEFGIIGLLFAGGLLWLLLLGLMRVRKAQPSIVAIEGYLLAFMAIAGLVSFPWQTSMAGPLAGFLIGWWWPEHREASGGMVTPASHLQSRSACLLMGGAAFSLLIWFGLDAYLNHAVPRRLAVGCPQDAESILSGMDYRYRALVGAAYAEQGEIERAKSTLSASEKGFRDVLLWNNLNHVLAKTGEWEESVSLCEQWSRCGLDYSNALRNLSIAYEQTGRYKEAAETLGRQMIFWHLRSATDIKRLAVLQFQSGNPQAAQETLLQYQRIWELSDSTTVAELENLMGGVNLAMGDRAEAEKCFRLALEYDPGLESAARNLNGLSESPPTRKAP